CEVSRGRSGAPVSHRKDLAPRLPCRVEHINEALQILARGAQADVARFGEVLVDEASRLHTHYVPLRLAAILAPSKSKRKRMRRRPRRAISSMSRPLPSRQ